MQGMKMYRLMEKLFPINRSLTGDGVRTTLNIINDQILDFNLNIYEIPTGTKVFDWEVPKEWNVKKAFIIDPKGNKICDFNENNLNLVGYSIPINKKMSLEELQTHLYSLENQPDAIPYITSYYSENWGFCLKHQDRLKLKDGIYTVVIDSELTNGSLTYGELIIPGKTKKEVFFSTYICHASMANNELSGPVLQTSLINYISKIKDRKFTYRFVFIPETIGSITYLSENHIEMKKNIIAGFNITCVGDNKNYSYLPSRDGNTLADKLAKYVLNNYVSNFNTYTYLDRGSDERQYCSPGIDLPVASVMRSKYDEYAEYHTSLDNLDFCSADGLQGSYEIYTKIIEIIENNNKYKINVFCEPQLGKRGLYPTISTKESVLKTGNIINILAYCDGNHTMLEIALLTNIDFFEVKRIIDNINSIDSTLLKLI